MPRNPAPADPRKPAPSGDVGPHLESEQCQTPPVCLVTLLYTGGRLLRYDSGNPLPHTVYELAGGTFGADGSFATSGADTQNPSETASVSGRIVDLDADNVADQVEATVTFPDGPQDLTLVDYPDIDYDHYKCWGSIADGFHCPAALEMDSCSITPLGGNQFTAQADVLYKYGPADVTGPIDTVGVGHTVLEGGAEFGFSISAPLDQPFSDGSVAFTSSHTGTTSGTVSVDVTSWGIPAASTLKQFQFSVGQTNGPQASSNLAVCPAP